MIGLFFADGPPERIVETASAFDTQFAIPPGAPRHEVVGEYSFERPGKLLTLFPHMHVRGVAFRYDMIHPDGREEPILSVLRHDFNWQLAYELKEPLAVEPERGFAPPGGSTTVRRIRSIRIQPRKSGLGNRRSTR